MPAYAGRRTESQLLTLKMASVFLSKSANVAGSGVTPGDLSLQVRQLRRCEVAPDGTG